MVKITYTFFIVLFGIAAAVNAKQKNEEREVSYAVVSKENKGDNFIIYRFSDDGCSFWEYFRGKAFNGHVVNTDSLYSISSIGFSFEYPKPFALTKNFQGAESFSKYIGKRYVSVGGKKILVHKFYVSNDFGDSKIFISDKHMMPIGYDSKNSKVRITDKGLRNLQMISCRKQGS